MRFTGFRFGDRVFRATKPLTFDPTWVPDQGTWQVGIPELGIACTGTPLDAVLFHGIPTQLACRWDMHVAGVLDPGDAEARNWAELLGGAFVEE